MKLDFSPSGIRFRILDPGYENRRFLLNCHGRSMMIYEYNSIQREYELVNNQEIIEKLKEFINRTLN